MQRSLPRNSELDPSSVLEYILGLADSGKSLGVTCMGCSTSLYKTSGCNEMSHCGVKTCFYCGYSGLFTDTLGLVDHFENGRCPRFSTADWWHRVFPGDSARSIAMCDARCQNGAMDCALPCHRLFREIRELMRRASFIRAAIRSLPDELKMRSLAPLTEMAFKANPDRRATLVLSCMAGYWPRNQIISLIEHPSAAVEV